MKYREENISVIEIVIRVIGIAGLLSIALVAPNALKLFKNLRNKKYNQRYYINVTVRRLLDKKLLKEVDNGKGEGKSVVLTEKGRVVLLRYQSKEKIITKKWDKKWRILMFDIWETNRKKRDALRKEIRQLGFVQLQQSIWIYPYDCREYIELIKSELHFGKNVRYMEVSNLDDDNTLRRYFNLF